MENKARVFCTQLGGSARELHLINSEGPHGERIPPFAF